MGRYEVHGVLGRGGMGSVCAAWDRVRGHEVALKRLALEKFDKPSSRRRATALFEREYHTLAQLAHPSVIAVYDYGVDDEGPYYTMERLHGQSLREQSPIALQQACAVIRDVASALALVHSRGLVHRDVTPLNIHRLPEGRAKLIDFGALSPMSVAKQIVGTPPYIAPECVRLQTLDARTDLYALGACLYYALTGRHAYPARDLRALRDVWRTTPLPPSRMAPGVPRELDTLVLSMLHLDVSGRPRSAGEVIERLTAIAGLEPGEHAAVSRAYAVNPSLVGRDAEIRVLRRNVLTASRGRRSAYFLIEGVAGIGRSRLLDAAVLEAKLAGMKVARADGSDGHAPFGVARRLLHSIAEETPECAVDVEALRLPDDAGSPGDGHLAGKKVQRDVLIEQMVESLLSACERHGWAVVVDDLHLIDEPSLAVMAVLASRAPARRALVLASVQTVDGSRADHALELIRESAQRLTLSPLNGATSRQLLASLFGEVPNLDMLTAIVARACGGVPRDIVNGAHALIDEGLVRYEGGNWLVLDDARAIESTLASQGDFSGILERLSRDAVEMVSLMCLDRDGLMTLADYPSLTDHGDSGRVHRALTELVQARVVAPVDDRTRFVREADAVAIARRIEESRRRELHRRLAERIATLPMAMAMVYEAFHFAKAGLPRMAMAPIDRLRDYAKENPDDEILRRPIVLDALAEVLRFSAEDGIDDGFRAEHEAGLVINAMYSGFPERVAAVAPDALKRFMWFSGLSDYDALAHLDDGPRLFKMLELAGQRCVSSGRPALNPVEAVRRLSQLCLMTAVCARCMSDPEILKTIPDLTPFLPLSPAIGIAKKVTEAVAGFTRGQLWQGWDTIKAVALELRGPTGEQIDSFTRAVLEGTALGYLCAMEAEHATGEALSNIDEYSPRMPALAESHRARYYRALGDVGLAQKARRCFEVLSVQGGGFADSRVVELPANVALCALSEDLLGLKRAIAQLEKVSATRPRWRSTLALARAHYLRCRGETAKALEGIEASLGDLSEEHADWCPSAALHVELLNQSHEYEKAVELGARYLERARLLGVPTVKLELAVAVAHAEQGDGDRAERLFRSAVTHVETRSVGGVLLGYCYEMGARIAQRMGDDEEFERRSQLCGVQYRLGKNPLLIAKHEALHRAKAFDKRRFDARSEAATVMPSVATEGLLSRVTFSASGDLHADVLSWLVEQAGAEGGFLYLKTKNGLERASGTPGLAVPDELDEDVVEYCAACSETGEATATATAGFDQTMELEASPDFSLGRRFVPILLESRGAGADSVLGVVVLAIDSENQRALAPESAAFVARLLSERQAAAP